MALLPLPWTAHQLAEAIEIRDAAGRVLSYSYFDDDYTRRGQNHRLTLVDAWLYAGWVVATPAWHQGAPRDPAVRLGPIAPPFDAFHASGGIAVRDFRGQELGLTYIDHPRLPPARRIGEREAVAFVRWVISTPRRFPPPATGT